MSRQCLNWLARQFDCDEDAVLRDSYDYLCCYTDMCNNESSLVVNSAPVQTSATPNKGNFYML